MPLLAVIHSILVRIDEIGRTIRLQEVGLQPGVRNNRGGSLKLVGAEINGATYNTGVAIQSVLVEAEAFGRLYRASWMPGGNRCQRN